MSTTQKSLVSWVKAALAEGMNTSKAKWVVELDSKILSVREQDSRTSLLVYGKQRWKQDGGKAEERASRR